MNVKTVCYISNYNWKEVGTELWLNRQEMTRLNFGIAMKHYTGQMYCTFQQVIVKCLYKYNYTQPV